MPDPVTARRSQNTAFNLSLTALFRHRSIAPQNQQEYFPAEQTYASMTEVAAPRALCRELIVSLARLPDDFESTSRGRDVRNEVVSEWMGHLGSRQTLKKEAACPDW